MSYSYQTSMPAYLENQALNKKRQCDEIMEFIKRGANNLLQLEQLTGLPSARISARMSDLKNEKKAKYDGHVIYENMKRKRIVIVKNEIKISQLELF